MDELTGALTDTGTDEGIFLGRLFAQAYLTSSLQGSIDNMIAFIELQVGRLLKSLGFVVVFDF